MLKKLHACKAPNGSAAAPRPPIHVEDPCPEKCKHKVQCSRTAAANPPAPPVISLTHAHIPKSDAKDSVKCRQTAAPTGAPGDLLDTRHNVLFAAHNHLVRPAQHAQRSMHSMRGSLPGPLCKLAKAPGRWLQQAHPHQVHSTSRLTPTRFNPSRPHPRAASSSAAPSPPPHRTTCPRWVQQVRFTPTIFNLRGLTQGPSAPPPAPAAAPR